MTKLSPAFVHDSQLSRRKWRSFRSATSLWLHSLHRINRLRTQLRLLHPPLQARRPDDSGIADLPFSVMIIRASALNLLDAVARLTSNEAEAAIELAVACKARSLAQGLWLVLFAH